MKGMREGVKDDSRTFELSDWKDGVTYQSVEMGETSGGANMKGKIKISVIEMLSLRYY